MARAASARPSERSYQRGDTLLHHFQGQWLSDDPGGSQKDFPGIDPQGGGDPTRKVLAVADSLFAGAGVGATGIDQNGPSLSGFHPLPGKKHRGRLHPVCGKDPGGCRRDLGIEKGEILDLGFLDARGQARSEKAGDAEVGGDEFVHLHS
jgi:hypothetical protein